jgi:hypothetical protein
MDALIMFVVLATIAIPTFTEAAYEVFGRPR